ncbi:hypothetical protein Baya_11218 [Bagarius yarrelli]|uniref:Uncharacterized protein n=1 Tax=Bagarius yarrelli TaxID=175774 RepID=A0A556V0G1_BAGYA|nr:hypothetical protein Baya_11218 [Bagarius yarrelli]
MENSKGYENWHYASQFTRAALLHYQLQKLSERERRARNHNRKLLQDFQRAQNTLSVLVSQTETMNTRRMEFARFLENYPKRQQKLQAKRLSEQQTMTKQHQKTSTLQTEKESHPFRIDAPSAIYPDQSHCAIFNSLSHTSVYRGNMVEVNIPPYYGNTSGSSDMSSKAAKSFSSEDQRTKNERKKESKLMHKSRKDAVSQWSPSVSDSPSVSNHKKQKQYEQSNAFKTSKVAVGSTKQLMKKNHDTTHKHINIFCKIKTEETNRYKDDTDEEEKILSPGQMRVNEVENRDSTANQGNRTSLCEEQNKEEEEEEFREQSSTDKEEEAIEKRRHAKKSLRVKVDSVRESEAEDGRAEEEEEEEESEEQSSTDEEEAQEEEPLRGNAPAKKSLPVEVDSVGESEAEDGQAEEEEEGDKIKKSRASGRRSKVDNNDQKGNYSVVSASCSEESIQDR